LLFVCLAAAGLAGCGDDEDAPEADTAVTEATAPPEESAPEGDQPVGDGAAGSVRLAKIGDFDQPVFVAQVPGGDDLYVAEKPGRVMIVRGGRSTPALDISEKVADSGEQGFLSIAFDPEFESSRLAYAYYTGNDQDQRVVEFRVSEDGSFDAGSEREVLKMEDFATNHNGGLVSFGPDGLLYIGTGDGGDIGDPERNGQDLGSPLGKLLRIDPHGNGGRPYSVPADNPFSKKAGARPEVYSYGLRNPWRFSFDRETGALAIADVGQSSQEEVDFVAAGQGAGANFGWSAFEGTQRLNSDQDAPGHVEPVLTYGRDAGCSITGGHVVRDPGLPSLYGCYLYGDYCAGELRSFVPSPKRATGDRALGLTVPSLSSFAEDAVGHIYATSLEGPVYRLEAASARG
jgi:glucose/arabinose dehydrogenase